MTHADYSAWIGREQTTPDDLITPRLVRSYDATLGDGLSEDGLAGIQWLLCPEIVPGDQTGADGHPARDRDDSFLPPIPLRRRMWAGGELEFHMPLKEGDVVTKTTTIKDIAWKEGSTGQLCFVILNHDYHGPNGLAVRERQDLVYRPAANQMLTFATPEPTPESDGQRQITINTLMLFRYSALTFNGHRIHYDAPYAQTEEFYPDVVIHGPLQATLLLHEAIRVRGHVPKRFSFRGVLPATGPQVLTLLHKSSGDDLHLRAQSSNGHITTKAKASW